MVSEEQALEILHQCNGDAMPAFEKVQALIDSRGTGASHAQLRPSLSATAFDVLRDLCRDWDASKLRRAVAQGHITMKQVRNLRV
jgi:hypothetical protein